MLKGPYDLKAELAVQPAIVEEGILPAVVARMYAAAEMVEYQPVHWAVRTDDLRVPPDWVVIEAVCLPNGSMN